MEILELPSNVLLQHIGEVRLTEIIDETPLTQKHLYNFTLHYLFLLYTYCCSWFTVVLVEVKSSQIIAEFFLIFYLVSCSRVTTNVLGINAYSSQICPICFHLLSHSVVFLHNIIQIQQCYYIGT